MEMWCGHKNHMYTGWINLYIIFPAGPLKSKDIQSRHIFYELSNVYGIIALAKESWYKL